MKRTLALLAAAALLAGVAAEPAWASARDDDCVPVEQGCLPWSQVNEYTELYLAPGAGGQVQGFQQFANFASHVRATMGADVSISGGTLRVDTSAPTRVPSRVPTQPQHQGQPEYPEPQYPEPQYPEPQYPEPQYPVGSHQVGPVDAWPGSTPGGGWAVRSGVEMADYAMFYERSNWQGSAFMVMPSSSEDLTMLRHPFGGTWKGRVRAVAIMGGQPGKPGVQLCADVACVAKTPILLWNGSQFLIPPAIVSMISRVSVFPT